MDEKEGAALKFFAELLREILYLSQITIQISSEALRGGGGRWSAGRDGGGEAVRDLNIALPSQTATKAFRSGRSWDEIAPESPEIYATARFLVTSFNQISAVLPSPHVPSSATSPTRLS